MLYLPTKMMHVVMRFFVELVLNVLNLCELAPGSDLGGSLFALLAVPGMKNESLKSIFYRRADGLVSR